MTDLYIQYLKGQWTVTYWTDGKHHLENYDTLETLCQTVWNHYKAKS